MATKPKALQVLLDHCDGKDCTCGAWNRLECGCDADWTPAEIYKLRWANERLKDKNRQLTEKLNDYERSMWLIVNAAPGGRVFIAKSALLGYNPKGCTISCGTDETYNAMWVAATHRVPK